MVSTAIEPRQRRVASAIAAGGLSAGLFDFCVACAESGLPPMTIGKAVARGLSQYAAGEVRRLAGRHSRDIEAVLGYTHGQEIVHRDDLVTLVPAATAGGIEA